MIGGEYVGEVAMDGPELYYQTAYGHLRDQDRRNSELEGKAVGLLGITSFLTGVGVILLKDFSNDPGRGLTEVTYAAIAVLALSFLGILLSTFNVLRPCKWSRKPQLGTLAQHAAERDADVTTVWVGNEINSSVEHNEPIVHAKVIQIKYAILGIGMLVLALITLATSLRL